MKQQFIGHKNKKYQTNIKNRTYYFFNDIINIKNSESNLLKTEKKSHKNIDIYYIGYITIKNISDYENIHSINPLYLIISEADGYIKEKNGNKYLIFASIDKNKEVLKKYTELWDKIKYLIKTIGEYEKEYMKIRFNSDDIIYL